MSDSPEHPTCTTGFAGKNHNYSVNAKTRRPWLWAMVISMVVALLATTAFAASLQIEQLRVTAEQVGEPVKVRVIVTEDGNPVSGLAAEDFSLRLGQEDMGNLAVSVPATEDATQRLSLVFVMDFTQTMRDSGALEPLQNATSQFVKSLTPGDFAAIVKFNGTLGASVELGFTEIMEGDNFSHFDDVIYRKYGGSFTNLFDAILLAVNEFSETDANLPAGPRAIIVGADGEEDGSSEVATARGTVVDAANQNNISIYTIGLGDVNDPENTEWLNNMLQLADGTGGEYFDATADPKSKVDEAYAVVADNLSNEYVITFDSGISDCEVYKFTLKIADAEKDFQLQHRGCIPPATGSGGGGGGAFGPLGLIAGLSLLAMRRRLRDL